MTDRLTWKPATAPNGDSRIFLESGGFGSLLRRTISNEKRRIAVLVLFEYALVYELVSENETKTEGRGDIRGVTSATGSGFGDRGSKS